MLTPLDKLIVWIEEEIVWRRRMLVDLGGGQTLLHQDEILAERVQTVAPKQPGTDGRLVLVDPPDEKRTAAAKGEDVPDMVRASVVKLRREVAWFEQNRKLMLAVQSDNWDRIDRFKTAIQKPPGRTYDDRQEALR